MTRAPAAPRPDGGTLVGSGLVVGESADPFAAVAALDGVGAAASHARDAVDALLSDPDDVGNPVLQGALRATAEAATLQGIWKRSPGQVLARLHLLAARDLAAPATLGRPRKGTDGARFGQLIRLASGPTRAPAVVVAALVHGELRSLAPFGSADGVE